MRKINRCKCYILYNKYRLIIKILPPKRLLEKTDPLSEVE